MRRMAMVGLTGALALGAAWYASTVTPADAGIGSTMCRLGREETGTNFTRICDYSCGVHFAAVTTNIPGSCPKSLEF